MTAATQQNYEVKAGLETLAAFYVLGISARITSGHESAAEEINALWQAFFEQQIAHRIQERCDDVIYAVYSEYEGDHTKPYRLTIGYRMVAQWSPRGDDFGALYPVQVAAGDYAMMGAAGEQPKALLEAWQAVWQSDLDRCFDTDFEVYGPRFFEEGVHEVLVAIGVKLEDRA